MRRKERIDIVLDHIDWFDYIRHLNIFETNQEIDDVVITILGEINALKDIWKENPDWRLTQLLVNTNIVPNFPGVWYYEEETNYLIDSGKVLPQEILFWGTYGKDGKQPLRFVLIKDMESDHLDACLKTQKNMNQTYREAMKCELEFRNLIDPYLR